MIKIQEGTATINESPAAELAKRLNNNKSDIFGSDEQYITIGAQDLSRISYIRIGPTIDSFVQISSIGEEIDSPDQFDSDMDQLQRIAMKLATEARDAGIPIRTVGNLSNTLLAEELNALVLSTMSMRGYYIDTDTGLVRAQAGVMLPMLSRIVA